MFWIHPLVEICRETSPMDVVDDERSIFVSMAPRDSTDDVHSVSPFEMRERATGVEVDPLLPPTFLGFEFELSWVEVHEFSAEFVEFLETDPSIPGIEEDVFFSVS